MAIDLDRILPFTVSGLRPGEQADVVRLVAECGLSAEGLSTQALRHFIVARKGNRIIAAVGLELTGVGCALRSLAVQQSHRRQGVAAKLVAAAERYALSHGLHTLYLLTDSEEAFFAHCGYVKSAMEHIPAEIRATSEFSKPGSDAALCMHKQLSR